MSGFAVWSNYVIKQQDDLKHDSDILNKEFHTEWVFSSKSVLARSERASQPALVRVTPPSRSHGRGLDAGAASSSCRVRGRGTSQMHSGRGAAEGLLTGVVCTDKDRKREWPSGL